LQGERWLDIIFNVKMENEVLEEGHILVDVNKYATEDFVFE
jgi:hypothetical protein